MANGNDTVIAENGGEKNTDEYSEIALITSAEYQALPDDEKAEYVMYTPALQSDAYNTWINAQNQLLNALGDLSPALDKLMPFTKGLASLPALPLSSLLNAVQAITSVAETMGSVVSTIASTPVIGIVAQPLQNLFGLVGALGGMIYALYMNPYQFIEPYAAALSKIDISGLKDQITSISMPDLNISTDEISQIPIPDEEIKATVDNVASKVKELAPTVEDFATTTETLQQTAEALKGIPPILEAASTMGCSWAFSAVLDDFTLNFEQPKLPDIDSTLQINQWANGVKELTNLPIKYIKTSDLQKLKGQNTTKVEETDSGPSNQAEYDQGYNEGYNVGREGNNGAYLEENIINGAIHSQDYVDGARKGWNDGYDEYVKQGN